MGLWTPSRLRMLEGAGSHLLAPGKAHGIAQWPKCAQCKRNVDAYGIDEDTPRFIEFWARCDGKGGLDGGEHSRPERAGIRIDKSRWPGGWTRNTASDVLARLVIRPGKFAKWELVVGDPHTVRPT